MLYSIAMIAHTTSSEPNQAFAFHDTEKKLSRVNERHS
jgi:hypothetical protein